MQESGESQKQPSTALQAYRQHLSETKSGQPGDVVFHGKRYQTPALFPDSVDDPLIEELLESIRNPVDGKCGLNAACEKAGLKPSTVRLWAQRDTPRGFKELYREARQIQMAAYGDQIIETADAADRGEDRDTAGAVYRDQLKIKTRQWLMERQAPAEFGQRGVVDEAGKAVPKQVIRIGSVDIAF